MINCLNILILILFINLGVGKIDVLISIMNYYIFSMICFHKYNPSSMKITFTVRTVIASVTDIGTYVYDATYDS